MKRTLSILFLFFGLILGFSQMKGIAIKWFSKEGSHFYFDTPNITKIPFDRYPQVKDTKGRNIVIPKNIDDNLLYKIKSKNINVDIGKDFFIYTPMKIYENKDIIKKLNLSKK